MARKRLSFSSDFKARAALEVLKGHRTVNEIAGDLGVHPVQLSLWKKQALDRLSEVFSKPKNRGEEEQETLLASLYQEIGQLKMELDWVKKKLASSVRERRGLVEVGHPCISLRRQCSLLGLPRSSYYYQPVRESERNLAVMKALDELYTKWPFYGSRRMLHELRELGHLVNRKRVQRLSRLMGLETIYPQKRPQFDGAQHRIFPYLESVPDALASLARYLRFYNDERKHQALGYRTPRSVYLDQAALN